jgi:hypothetical protein
MFYFAGVRISVLQKAINQAAKYCRHWNLKCNLNKPPILVFYQAGKLKTNNRWNIDDQIIEVSNDINYLGLIL